MLQTHGATYRAMRQRKIESYRWSIKNGVKPAGYYLPWESEREIASFVDHYRNGQYRE